ncbi:MAG: hypothetical protein WC417_04945 [Candidatus Omnitrophota bacterium]|jgi:tetratricopeptide (TPR) repeat protein
MKKIFFLLVILSIYSSCYAAGWKSLHEKADHLTLEQALSAAARNNSSLDDQYVLGLVYLNLHKDKDAQVVFLSMLTANPGLIEARWGEAEVSRRRHELDAAEKACEKIISLNPDFSPAYVTLAFIKYLRMDFTGAVKLATKVIRQGRGKVDLSNYARAYSLLAGANGMIAHYGGPISKAINGAQVMPNLRRAQSLEPESAGVLFGLGSYYFLAPGIIGGDLNKAQDYLKKAIKADPFFSDAYVRLAQVYKVKGDIKEYELYLAKVIAIDPQNELALDIKNNKCKFICKD